MVVVFLVLLSFYMPYKAYKRDIIDYKYMICLLMFIVIHHFISFSLHPIGDIPAFNSYASRGLSLSSFRINNAYNISIVYGWFYRLQDSILVGNSLSIIGYVIAMLYLSKLMDLMSIESQKKVWVLVLTSFTPAALIFDSSVLREAWMLCFFIMFVYFLFKHYLTHQKKYIVFAYSALFLLLCLHFKSAIFYSFFISIFYFGFYYRKFYRFDAFLIAMVLIVSSVATIVALTFIISYKFGGAENIYSFLVDRIDHKIGAQFNKGTVTNYVLISDVNTNPILVMLKQFVRYWFVPYPWQLFSHGIASLVLGGVALIRLIMFICIVKSLLGGFRVNRESRFFINMLLLALLFTTFIFSLGTGNYGTSNRHWDISWWILCLVFVYTRKRLIVFKK